MLPSDAFSVLIKCRLFSSKWRDGGEILMFGVKWRKFQIAIAKSMGVCGYS